MAFRNTMEAKLFYCINRDGNHQLEQSLHDLIMTYYFPMMMMMI